MPPVDLYIVAAGNGSRINLDVPKALVTIFDEPCLTKNLCKIGDKFRRIFVITNARIQETWTDYFDSLQVRYPGLAEMTINLPIESGLGDGHATLRGICAAEDLEGRCLSHDIVVAWGDVIIPNECLIEELLMSVRKGTGLLPAVMENNPYVSLLVDESMRCIAADFSKFGENRSAGFHDQSVFRFDLPALRNALRGLHNALWKNGRYITLSGELSLLYSFHYLYNVSAPAYVYETRFPTLGFNTAEDLSDVRQRLLYV